MNDDEVVSTENGGEAAVTDARSKLPLMRRRTLEYLELAARDPESYPISVEAVADFVPVGRRIFYKQQPGYRALLERIVDAKRAFEAAKNKPAAPPQAVAPVFSASQLTDEQLTRSIERLATESTWGAQRFVGQRKRVTGVDAAPLLLHDLELLRGALDRQIRQMHPLVAELLRRKRMAASAASLPEAPERAIVRVQYELSGPN